MNAASAKKNALDPRLKSRQDTPPAAHIQRLKGSRGFHEYSRKRRKHHDFRDTTDAAQILARGERRGCRNRRNKPSEARDRPAGEASLHAFLAADRTVCVSLLRPAAWILQAARYRTRHHAGLRLADGQS